MLRRKILCVILLQHFLCHQRNFTLFCFTNYFVFDNNESKRRFNDLKKIEKLENCAVIKYLFC